MDRILRNLAVVLLGAATSALTAAVLVFLELRGGQTLFGYTAWSFVPVGAIGAGLLGSLGYLVSALALRIRPGMILLVGVFTVSAATHLYVGHLDNGLMMAPNRSALMYPKAFTQFAAASLVHTRLPSMSLGLGGGSSSSESADSGSSGSTPEGPRIDTQGDSNAEGMAQGVGGMLAKADMGTQLGAGDTGKLSKISGNVQAINQGVENNGLAWVMAVLQIAGFAVGGLMVASYLRSLSYCHNCELFLSTKGRQTRYFNSSNGVHSSVDEFLAWMKNQQLQQGIQAHNEVGSGKKHNFSEYSSTIEIRTCRGCRTHKLEFSAKRKKGNTWKDIKLLRHSATSLEPIDVTRT